MSGMNEFILKQVRPATPLTFNEEKCIGCNRCMEACQIDVMLPGEKKGKHPIVAYPDECWYCGCCVMECPTGAIKLHHPLMNQTRWVEKASLIKEKGEK